MTQFNYCKTTFCRHLLFLVLALSFGFTAQAKDNSITLPPTSPHFGPSQINVIFDHYTPGSRERVRIILPQFGIKLRLVACEDRYASSLPMPSDMGCI